jgi:hypothetical protein
MFEEIVLDAQRLIADIQNKQKYSKPEMISHIRQAILTFNDTKGIASSRLLRYAFRALTSDDPTKIDRNIYENVDNISMNYQIEPEDNAAISSIETIAKLVRDKQIALVTIYWTQEGSTGVPVVDVSFDKDHENGESLRGTFLADDTRISTIENGVMIDTSMIVSKTFSVKWSFPIGTDYKIKDTMVKLFLVDAAFMLQNQYDLARMAASNILKIEAVIAAKDGQSESYVGMLKDIAEGYISEIRGLQGGSSVPASTAKGIDHTYDRDKFADRAFDKVSQDGTWVEVIGNEIIGRTIRIVE